MSSDVFGWFTGFPLLLWVVVIGGLFVYLWRKGSDLVTGRKPALLFYGLAFFAVLEYAKRLGDAVDAPIPITVILLAFYGLGFYYIWKGGNKSE